MKQFDIILFAFIALINSTICANEATIDDSKIWDVILKIYHENDFYAFNGIPIPYAKPPTGEKRFKEPEPYGKFESIFDAPKDGNLWAQLSSQIALINSTLCANEATIDDLKIRGVILKNHHENDFYAFRGIPYAKPPTGERRFKEPEPYGKFESIFDATKDGNLCPQLTKNIYNKNSKAEMSEDCLNLNVYTKTLNKDDKKPVLFYIHGGAFLFGTGASELYNPKYLLDEDIVLVTINYRLGPFGYLVSETKDAVGNYGFKDQNLALKWVQENIEHFGGDPNSVTLIGHSSGSMSTILHMVSPMSKNLFHKVIAMGGSPTNHWVSENLKWSKTLSESVGCPTDHADKMVECLREKPWDVLVASSPDWLQPYGVANLIWNYEIEKNFGQERFLTDDPSVLFKKGDYNKVPLLAGITEQEFDDQSQVMILNTDLFNDFKENFNKYAPTLFGYKSERYNSDMISEKLKSFYFKDKPITISSEKELGEMFSDSFINHGVHRLVQLASEYEDVYYYRMDYKGNYTCSLRNSEGKPRYAAHADILNYVFVFLCATEFKDNSPDYTMVKRFTKYFTNFARSGNPNTGLNEDDVKCTNKWLPSTKGNIKTLYIGETCSVSDGPFQDRLKVWDNLFPVD